MKEKEENITYVKMSFNDWYVKHKNNIYKYVIGIVSIFFFLGFLVLINPIREVLNYFNSLYLETTTFNVISAIFTGIMFFYPTIKVFYLRNKKNKALWVTKEISIFIHLILSSVFMMFASWHSIVDLYYISSTMTDAELTGLLFYIVFLLLYLSGVFITMFYIFSQKLRLRHIHITLSLAFTILLVLHLVYSS